MQVLHLRARKPFSPRRLTPWQHRQWASSKVVAAAENHLLLLLATCYRQYRRLKID